MSNSKAAAERCAELANKARQADGRLSDGNGYSAQDFEPGHEIGYEAQAFRKYVEDVSDAIHALHAWHNKGGSETGCVPAALRNQGVEAWANLNSFLLPERVDPVVEAVGAIRQHYTMRNDKEMADALREALAARGLKIVDEGQ